MTYKEFVEWCNQRACDGCWCMHTAMYCIGVIREVRTHPFWKREKVWQRLNKEYKIVDNIVVTINQKMKEIGL